MWTTVDDQGDGRHRRCGRRAVLAAAVFGGLASLGTAGCDLFTSPDPPPAPDPLAPLRDQAHALADRYASAIAALPDLAGRLQPLREEHLTHVAELNKLIRGPVTPAASPSATAPASPGTAAALLAALRTTEETGLRDATAACLAAPAARAALVGSIAACRASHLEVLK